MSFGFSISDAVTLSHLAWNVVQNSRKACGEHAEFTREASALHVVLRRLQQETGRSNALTHTPDETRQKELQGLIRDCRKVLSASETILAKSNALDPRNERGRLLILKQKIHFGNGEILDLNDLRNKATFYASTISAYLNAVTASSIGRVEKQMNEAGGDLQDIKSEINTILAQLLHKRDNETSVLTAYANDERSVWKDFRRSLIGKGFSSLALRENKDLIMKYIEELGSRGLLDDQTPLGSLHEERTRSLDQGPALLFGRGDESQSITDMKDIRHTKSSSESSSLALGFREPGNRISYVDEESASHSSHQSYVQTVAECLSDSSKAGVENELKSAPQARTQSANGHLDRKEEKSFQHMIWEQKNAELRCERYLESKARVDKGCATTPSKAFSLGRSVRAPHSRLPLHPDGNNTLGLLTRVSSVNHETRLSCQGVSEGQSSLAATDTPLSSGPERSSNRALESKTGEPTSLGPASGAENKATKREIYGSYHEMSDASRSQLGAMDISPDDLKTSEKTTFGISARTYDWLQALVPLSFTKRPRESDPAEPWLATRAVLGSMTSIIQPRYSLEDACDATAAWIEARVEGDEFSPLEPGYSLDKGRFTIDKNGMIIDNLLTKAEQEAQHTDRTSSVQSNYSPDPGRIGLCEIEQHEYAKARELKRYCLWSDSGSFIRVVHKKRARRPRSKIPRGSKWWWLRQTFRDKLLGVHSPSVVEIVAVQTVSKSRSMIR